MKVIVLLLIFVLIVGCASNEARTDPNYVRQLESAQRMAEVQSAMAQEAFQACQHDSNPGLCASSVSERFSMAENTGGGQQQGNPFAPAPPQQQRSYGQEVGLRVLDGMFGALPMVGQWAINRDNTRANVAISESNDQMMGDVMTTGFSELGETGRQPSYQAGQNLTIGDGNIGDGNDTIGDGNVGDDNVGVGDGSMIGDGNVGRDSYGDGSLIGDENRRNLIGDENVGNDDESDNSSDNSSTSPDG